MENVLLGCVDFVIENIWSSVFSARVCFTVKYRNFVLWLDTLCDWFDIYHVRMAFQDSGKTQV